MQKKVIHTFAASGFLQEANICFGGVGNVVNCFTNSRPIPLLAPVIKTFPKLILALRNFEKLQERKFTGSDGYALTRNLKKAP